MRIKILFTLIVLLFSGVVLAQTALDSSGTILIGGIKQYVSVKSKDNTKPLLLFLHGGPGNSVMHYAEKFTNKLQEHFIVVQWDQRESGKTLNLNKSPEPLQVSLFQNDTKALIDSLLKRFNHPKLYLVGHSWGAVPGFYMAKNHPHLLHAYIPICPMINQLDSERIILELMKEKARRTKNRPALEELVSIAIPFENGEQLYYHRKWVLDYMGSKAKITKQQVQDWAVTWLAVFNEASKDNFFNSVPALKCPIYFFVGRKDYQTNSSITEKYFQSLTAPKKELFWFERSAHSLPTTEPDLMQRIIIEKILPATH
jgi:pimeloyl-ACP methyl ester carboxylesterase